MAEPEKRRILNNTIDWDKAFKSIEKEKEREKQEREKEDNIRKLTKKAMRR